MCSSERCCQLAGPAPASPGTAINRASLELLLINSFVYPQNHLHARCRLTQNSPRKINKRLLRRLLFAFFCPFFQLVWRREERPRRPASTSQSCTRSCLLVTGSSFLVGLHFILHSEQKNLIRAEVKSTLSALFLSLSIPLSLHQNLRIQSN